MAGWRPLLALVVLLASGCVAAPQDAERASAPATDWAALGASLAVEHDHTDRAQHEEVARGLSLLSWGALSEDGLSLGEYGEADAAGGLVAVTSSVSEGATFVLLDAAALPDLKVLSRTWEPGAYGDVKLDREGPLLYHAHASGKGFSIWDVADPAKPMKAGEAQGGGCHMLHPQRIDGVPHVWCADVQPTLYRIEEVPGQGLAGVPVARLTPQSDPEVLRYATYYQKLLPGPAGLALLTTPHDMTAQDDPLDGRPLVAVAYELQGIRLYDVSSPGVPREIGHWRGEGLEGEMQRVHTVLLAKVGERRVAFAATETFTDVPPQFYLVDFTDLAKPVLLSVWTPPGIGKDDSIRFSAHNLQVVGVRMYAANFHGGMWVVDVADPAAPTPIALRVPVRDTEFPEKGKILLDDVALDTNMVWDVVVANGYAILTDMPAGVEVVAVDGDPRGDAAWSSTA